MRVIIYTGKGGVGKTSVAAATALRSAALGHRTVVISTDAAHSLSDSLEVPLSGTLQRIGENLDGLEIDIQLELETRWKEIQIYFSDFLASQGMDGVSAKEMAVFPGMELMSVGKMSGAVGTGAGFGPKAVDIQMAVMAELGLGVEDGPTQIVARDRYVELMSVLCNISCSMEKFATEVRNLQRGEIAEVSEPFDENNQVGSSTMAHKKNPVTAENVCGLARIVRGFMSPSFESAILWHERDLTNSSAERFFVPHSFILVDDMLAKMTKLFSGLVVNKEQMGRNLSRAGSVIMAESVILALVGKGMGRQDAHELIRKCSMESQRACEEFKSYLMANKGVISLLSEAEIDAALDPRAYLGTTGQTVDNILKIVS